MTLAPSVFVAQLGADLEALRGELAGIVARVVEDATKHNASRVEAATTSSDGTRRRGVVGTPPPTLLALPPGLGKTTTLQRALEDPDTPPALVLTPLGAEARSWAAALGGRATMHLPRRDPAEIDIDATTSRSARGGVCWLMDEVVGAGAANHAPSAAICRRCPHGLRSQWLAVTPGSDQEAALMARIEAAVASSPSMPHPLDPTTKPCGYLPALRHAASSDVLIASATAFTSTMLDRRSASIWPGEKPLPEDRMLVVDEAPALTRSLVIDARDASTWLAALSLAQMSLQREREHGDSEELAGTAAVLDDVRLALQELHELLVAGELPRDKVEAIALALAKGAKRAPASSSIHAGRWEAVVLRWSTRDNQAHSTLDAALRGAADLGWAATYGALRLVPASISVDASPSAARIECSAPTQIGAELAEVKNPTIIADATPSRVLRAMIGAQGGAVIDLHPPLQVTVWRDSTRSWARGRAKRARRLEQEAWEIVCRAHKLSARRGGRRPVILTHKPLARLIEHKGWWPPEDVGWWGADDKAHNRWVARDMVIAGVPMLSPGAAENLYRADRAMAIFAGAPEAQWPKWNGERVRLDGRTLYADLQIREWEEERLGAHLAQAIGRCRPLEHPQCEVLLLGPVVPLAQFGITVCELEPASVVGGAAERRHVEHLGRLLRLAEGALHLETSGEKITRAALRARGAGGRSSLYSELRAGIGHYGSARELVARLRGELDEAKAASGYTLQITTSRPDRHGRSRVLVQAVVDEAWLEANTRRVLRVIRRCDETRAIACHQPAAVSCVAQGP